MKTRLMFLPSPWAVFINPYFIVRRGIFNLIRQHAPRLQGKVLDFGAGRAPYRKLFSSASHYVTVDIEVSGHPDHLKSSDYFYDGKTLPFANSEFDAVFSSEVFEHVFGLPEILSELNRVLKPGGTLMFTAPFLWDEHEVPYDFGRYTQFGLAHLMTEAGFEVLERKKSTHAIATIFQLLSAYIFQRPLFRKHALLQIIGSTLIAAPINLFGLLLSLIFPDDESMYHNNFVIARKK